MKRILGWKPNFTTLHPAFELFHPSPIFSFSEWPSLTDYNQLLQNTQPSIQNESGCLLRVVSQSLKISNFEEQYEPRIYLKGELQTRENCWHDFFNLIMWLTFPKIKGMLNRLQYQSLQHRQEKNRSALENFLTLFDENGLVMVSANEKLLELVKQREWKSLFWNYKHLFNQEIGCYILGHSIYEKLLNPYVGMVGHALLLLVEKEFFLLSREKQILEVESKIYERLRSRNHDHSSFCSDTPKSLYPIPFLGFPNWHPLADRESFFNDEKYFRNVASF